MVGFVTEVCIVQVPLRFDKKIHKNRPIKKRTGGSVVVGDISFAWVQTLKGMKKDSNERENDST